MKLVSDMKVATLIGCHVRSFTACGGVPHNVLYDSLNTVVLERDLYGDGIAPLPHGNTDL